MDASKRAFSAAQDKESAADDAKIPLAVQIMNMGIFKIIFYVMLLLVGGAWLVLSVKHPDEKVVEFVKNDAGDWSVRFGSMEREFLENVARKIEVMVYDEATKHNPEGDFLPDQLDDKIKEELKSRVADR